MESSKVTQISGVIFGIIAIVHLIRAVAGWNASLNDVDIPLWASWLAVLVAGYLSFLNFTAE